MISYTLLIRESLKRAILTLSKFVLNYLKKKVIKRSNANRVEKKINKNRDRVKIQLAPQKIIGSYVF